MGNNEENETGIETPVKKITKEITKKHVYEIVKEATKRALKKRSEKLTDKQALKLETKLKKLSDDQKIEKFKKTIQNTSKDISGATRTDKELINKIDLFEKTFEKGVTSLKLPIVLQPLAAKLILLVIGTAAVSTFVLPEVPEASIEFITPGPVNEGQTALFVGSGRTESQGGYIASYLWESDRDGFLSNKRTFETSGLSPGNHRITFSVKDDKGEWSEPVVTELNILPVEHENNPPVANIDSIESGNVINSGTTMTFSGDGTDPDEDDRIIRYEWKIDGQVMGTSREFTEILPEGSHTVQFRVSDSNGEWSEPDSEIFEVLPENLSPLAFIDYIEPGRTVKLGTSVVFSGYGTDPDEDDEVTDYRWTINTTIKGYSSVFNVDDLPVGNHEIQFKVRDNHGLWSKPDIDYIEVLPNLPPIATIIDPESTTILYGTELPLSGYGTDPDINDDITGYEWKIDGNIFSNLKSINIDNMQIGNHNIEFRVKDSHEAWSNPDTVTIKVVQNNPPLAFISSPAQGDQIMIGTPVSFSGYGTDTDDTVTGFEWKIDGTIVSNQKVFTDDSLSPDEHVIEFRVRDSRNDWSDPVSRDIYIYDVNPVYVAYGVFSQKDLIVENGLCDNGIKNCDYQSPISGGGYYTMKGNRVLLNGHPYKFTDIIIDTDLSSKSVRVGESWDLGEGLVLVAIEIDVDNNNVWLNLVKDGATVESKIVYGGEVFTYSKNIAGEKNVPVFVTYIDVVFAGMNTNLVRLKYTWAISQDVVEIPQ